MLETVTITLKNNKPTYRAKTVTLSTNMHALIKGKGEGGTVAIFKKDLIYENTKNNQRESACGVPAERGQLDTQGISQE